MTRKWRALGLATFAVLALGALTAQGASAVNHEFRSVKSWTVGTGTSTGKMKLKVGAAGTVECKGAFEDTSGGSWNGSEYLSDTLTVTAHFSECNFGGQPATFNMNHCGFILDSDTTTGNPEGGEHANVEIECAEFGKIEIHTAACTITVAPQMVEHAIQYKSDTATSVNGIVSAREIELAKSRTTASQPVNGCLTFPSGAAGTVEGEGTTACLEDLGSPLTATEKTTPTGKTTEGSSIGCSVK